MNLIYAFITAKQFGKTNDSGIILFWSAIYIFISWSIFIWLPKRIFNNIKFGKFILLATPIMGIYAGVIYTILLGKIFNFSEAYIYFLPYAVLTGLIYGVFITMDKYFEKTSSNLFFAVPIIGVIFYIFFPFILPSQAFKYMPDKIQDKIVSVIIPKLKIGDPYKLCLTKLPNGFNAEKGIRNSFALATIEDEIPDDYSTSLSASNEFINFDMKVEKGIITELNYELKE